MKLDYAEERTRQLMDEYKLNDWSLEFSSRMTYAYGRCCFNKKKIVISKPITKRERSHKRFDFLVLHEIAHALAFQKYGKNVHHDKRWKDTYKSLGGKDFDYKPPFKPFKYIIECPVCSRGVFGRRKGNFACGQCCKKHNGGKYDSKYKMIFYNIEYDKESDTYEILEQC